MSVVLPAAVDRLHERLFVAAYSRLQAGSEDAGMRKIRRGLVAEATGDVAEIGAGTGLNFAHYGPAVRSVLALEPSDEMRRELEASAVAAADDRIRVVAGAGERLPIADASVDTVVGTFVLCSVADPPAVLREVARVLRPGGRYLGLEHVRSSRPGLARAQALVGPAWRWAVRGCRCDQDAVAIVGRSALSVRSATPFRGPRQPWPVRPGVRLVASATGRP